MDAVVKQFVSVLRRALTVKVSERGMRRKKEPSGACLVNGKGKQARGSKQTSSRNYGYAFLA